MIRSFAVVAIGATALAVVQLLAEKNAATFTNIPWAISLAALCVILAVMGGVAYRFLRGAVMTRLALIALVVIIANGVGEFVIGSDQAYPQLGLWLIIPYVIACWIGAGVVVALSKRRAAHTQ